MAERVRPHGEQGAVRRRGRLPARERRAVILSAAEGVFARCGYHRASLDEIAHAAGVSKALIYEHFASKRELHASLLDAHARDILARLERGAAQGATSEERLRGGIDAFLGFVEEHREAWRALFRDAAEPDVAELIARMQHEAAAVVGALMEPPEAGGDPVTRDLRVAMHAQLLSGGIQSLATWWDEHPDVPRAVLVDEAMAWGREGAGRPAAVRPDAR
jgi:AcrR family transcriptional regulator